MNWKVGDRAILVNDGYVRQEENLSVMGEECTLLEPSDDPFFDWSVDVAGEAWYAKCSCLRPIYDGNEKTSWEDCIDDDGNLIWQHKELVVIELGVRK